MFDSQFKKYLSDFSIDQQTINIIEKYAEFIWHKNQDLNLISRKMTTDEFLYNHILDSIMAIPYFPKNSHNIADLGSGSGLPAIIFAICFPQKKFYLFEKSPKKQEFLEECKQFAPNIIIKGLITNEIKDIDLITARAFKPISEIINLTKNYYLNGGLYFLLKGKKQTIDAELLDIPKKIYPTQFNFIPLKNPVLDVERHIVVFSHH